MEKSYVPVWVYYKNELSRFQGKGMVPTVSWGHDFAEGDFANHLNTDANRQQWC